MRPPEADRLPQPPSSTVLRAESIAAPLSALVVGSVAMGMSPIFVRLAYVGPFTSAFWRVALALPVLYAWLRVGERNRVQPRKAISRATFFAGIAFTGALFFWLLSIVATTIANATFYATTAPIWVGLFGWLIFRKRASASVLAGLGLCILGGGALLPQSFEIRAGGALGDIYALITGV